MKDTLNLGKINPNEQRNKVPKHIPSKVHPDTLFTFMTDFGFLLGCLEHKMLSPRYCEEDVRYLNLRRVKSLAYPMKCFCDISLKKLKVHMDWYGDYGIAFGKEWGMRHNIQPVHYLNEESDLRKDITEVLKAALNEEKAGSKTHEMLKNYLLHELMYYKPYQGKMKNRKTKKIAVKCLMDECEWRYIPDVATLELEQVIVNPGVENVGYVQLASNSMNFREEVSLHFEYSDIKHIVLQTKEEYQELSRAIDSWKFEDNSEILSKVIIWPDKQEDF